MAGVLALPARSTPHQRRGKRANRANTCRPRRHAGALRLPVGRRGSGPTARLAVPEGRDRRLAGRADGPRRAAGWPRAARHAPGPCVAARSGHRAEDARAQLDVYQHDEEGLQNIALDPNFEENGWIYLYYSPPLDTPVDDPATPTVNEGDAPVVRDPGGLRSVQGLHPALALPVGHGDTVDLDSEQQILRVPVDRGICCHVGGDIVFDARATCSSRPATTRTRSSRTAIRRSTSARVATRCSTPSARRRTRTTCAARSCASPWARAGATRSPRATCSRTTIR